jgi:L-rhamnose mutarotase
MNKPSKSVQIIPEYLEKTQYSSFKRFCKTLELRNDPALITAYKKVHSRGQAWPEITQGMKEVGILDMEIYLTGTRLFMIMDTVPDFDHEKAMNELAKKPRQSEWEAYMAKFQNTSTEAAADEKWQLMERIYKME